MKKKIIIAVSVILAVAALVAGWVFWKISKNPDKNIPSDIPTEFIDQDGDKLTYDAESKTLTVSGENIDADINELKNNIIYKEWFESAERLVFAEGVTYSDTDFGDFKNVRTVEVCSTMKSLDRDDMPPLEKYVVSSDNKNLYTDASGALYTIGYETYGTGETVKYVTLLDVPYNSSLTEYTVPDDVNRRIVTGALDTANLKKVIFGKGVKAEVYGALLRLKNIEFYEVHPENEKYWSDGQGVIYSKDKTKIYGIPSTVEKLTVSENFVSFANMDMYTYGAPLYNYNDYINYNTSLRKITFPRMIDNFNYEDLLYFANLEEIVFPENDSSYCVVDGVVFTKDMTEMVCYPSAKEGDYYEIPEGVVRIGRNCFATQKLKKLIISDSVETIDPLAFRYALGLESVTIGKNVKDFGEDIVSLTVGAFSLNPFEYCLNLWEIRVDTENPYFCSDFDCALYTKDMKTLMTFPAASRTSPVNVPDSVETIHSAFRNCRNVKVINIGKNVTDIFFYTYDEYGNYHAFENCASLQEINISPDNPEYSSKDGIVYSKNGGVMHLYPQGKTNENLILPDCHVPYGAIYNNKHLKTIYVPWEKPREFVKDGYFGEMENPWISFFEFPYEIYYTTKDGLSYEK